MASLRVNLGFPRTHFHLRLCLLGLLMFLVIACHSAGDREPGQPATALKLFVSETGMYEITAADLKAAGLDWENLDPAALHLSYRGRARPLWVARQGKDLVLRFYGQASESRYVRENVYVLGAEPGKQGNKGIGGKGWSGASALSAGGGRRDTTAPLRFHAVAAAGEADRAAAVVRAEENRLYSPRVEVGDHWFWVSLPAPTSQTFDLTLTNVASGPGRIRLALWASTEAPAFPDHHLRVSVNGRLVADKTWDGRGRRIIEAPVPAGILAEGANIVSVEAPGDTGAPADIVFVDWVEIRYPRFLIAESDRLAWESMGGVQRLSGFSGSVMVFDVTAPEEARRVTSVREQRERDGIVATFEGEKNRRYLAVGPAGFLRPTRVAQVLAGPDLRASDNGADYVVIGSPDLLEPLEPLLAWRESQGLRVMRVPVEAVYDQFNHGLPEPEALRAFLKYAADAWNPAPRYLLLVGDATYDPRGYITLPEANRLPSFLIDTEFGGETASDVAFAQLDEDLSPDIAVGRMPARTPEQVRTLVEKTLAYEQQPAEGMWRRRVLAVADGQEPSFRQDAQRFIEQSPLSFERVEVFPEAGAVDANRQVKRELEAGSLLVAYFGHGSVTQWGKDRIFTAADSAALSNGDRLPIVLNMTCLTGLFTHPRVESLAEALLWREGGGAVAVLAPTSLTLATDQTFLSQPLAEALLREQAQTLGEALLRAQRQVPTEQVGPRDVMQTFLLFGDPALRPAYP